MQDRIRQLTSSRYLLQLILALRYMRGSLSQEGEDIVIDRLHLLPKKGIYIDIGAGHPFRWSNTARLYRKGWSGTLVEPNPDRAALLRRFRRRDLVVEALVGAAGPTATMAVYDDGNYNTVDRELVVARAAYGLVPISELTTSSQSLSAIQAATVTRFSNRVSLICVDTEGSDLAVLRSGNWADPTLRPVVVVAEILDVADIRDLIGHPVVGFMESQNYRLTSRLKESAVFVDRSVEERAE
jgi:FkbM family methyltransferase